MGASLASVVMTSDRLASPSRMASVERLAGLEATAAAVVALISLPK